MGVGSLGNPLGNAAAELTEHLLLQLGRVHFRDDIDLDINILGVHLIHGHRIHRRVDDRIQCNLDVEQKQTDAVEYDIHQKVHLTHAEVLSPADEQHADNVHTTSGGTHA